MNYNDFDYFPNEDTCGYHPDADHEISSHYDDETEDEWYDNIEDHDDRYDDSMDGDHESGLASAGWGTDEDYGHYGDDIDAYHDYYGEDY